MGFYFDATLKMHVIIATPLLSQVHICIFDSLGIKQKKFQNLSLCVSVTQKKLYFLSMYR